MITGEAGIAAKNYFSTIFCRNTNRSQDAYRQEYVDLTLNGNSMHTDSLPFGSSRISYSYGGTGSKLLLCFHGYGESSSSFAFLEASLGEEFTLLAIDMPFHGSTDWKEGLFFDPQDLLALIGEILTRFPSLSGKWSLLGYSMGGRIALHLLQHCPNNIERMVLVAPDGLKVNGWYWLATQTRVGNWLFRMTMRNPGWFFFFLRIGDKLKLVNRSVYKFTITYIGDNAVREELYKRWTTMRGFKPDLPAIRTIIRDRQILVRLLYGRYDRIIRWERGEQFRSGIESYCELTLLPAGHQLLQPKNSPVLLALLKE